MKLTHPDSEQTVEVKAEHSGPYLTQGWTVADEPPAEEPKPKGK